MVDKNELLKKKIERFKDISELLIITLERIYLENPLVAVREYEDFIIRYHKRASELLKDMRISNSQVLPRFDLDDNKGNVV